MIRNFTPERFCARLVLCSAKISLNSSKFVIHVTLTEPWRATPGEWFDNLFLSEKEQITTLIREPNPGETSTCLGSVEESASQPWAQGSLVQRCYQLKHEALYNTFSNWCVVYLRSGSLGELTLWIRDKTDSHNFRKRQGQRCKCESHSTLSGSFRTKKKTRTCDYHVFSNKFTRKYDQIERVWSLSAPLWKHTFSKSLTCAGLVLPLRNRWSLIQMAPAPQNECGWEKRPRS